MTTRKVKIKQAQALIEDCNLKEMDINTSKIESMILLIIKWLNNKIINKSKPLN